MNRYKKLLKELYALKKVLEQLRQEKLELQKENLRLKGKLSETQGKLSETQDKLSDVNSDVIQLEAELDEAMENINKFGEKVDNVLDVLNGLQTEYNDNSSEMKDIMVNRASMESENKEIDIILNDYVDFGKINSNLLKNT